jgi:hypothetical protein
VDRARSPSGSGGQGVAGAVGFIGRPARVSAPDEGRGSSASVPRGTRCASGG